MTKMLHETKSLESDDEIPFPGDQDAPPIDETSQWSIDEAVDEIFGLD